jgi:hypothetical protein
LPAWPKICGYDGHFTSEARWLTALLVTNIKFVRGKRTSLFLILNYNPKKFNNIDMKKLNVP